MKPRTIIILLAVLVSLVIEFSCFVYSQPVGERKKIACIGNSITYGIGVYDRQEYSYPAQLQALLGNRWDVRNFGSSGRTMLKQGDYPDWNEREFIDAKKFLPDVVIIKLGTNDTKPQNWKYSGEFLKDYDDFLAEFKSLSSHPRIYLCTPVPAFPGDWGINDSIIRDGVIPLLRTLVERKHLDLIDLYTPLKSKSDFFPDKVHPNGDGAAVIAREVYNVLCRDFRLVKAPEPLGPVPSTRQLMWQDMEYCGFLHFNMNTFAGKEWGYGDESPSLFSPEDFDPDEIAWTAHEVGMKGLILTCKHHDGFCLWPSGFTDHSVKKSTWKNDTGDVVKELSLACQKYGIKFGVYLSPWDRNSREYGKPEYLTYYRNQLRELLTNYGEIFEVWFDGANGGDGFYGGARETRTIDRTSYYGWNETWSLVRHLQPNAVIFSDIGPDIRWVGNENGYSGETCWSTYTPVGEKGDIAAPGYVHAGEGMTGQEDGKNWIPAECDVSIRPGWFYHPAEDSLVKTPPQLFDLYCKSVGRNASLLLNVPPDRRGKFNRKDVEKLKGLKLLIDSTFSHNLAESTVVSASSIRGNDPHFGPMNVIDGDKKTYWATDDSVRNGSIMIEWKWPVEWNILMLQEYIALGQRIEEFAIDAFQNGKWKNIVTGTTIGHKRILKTPTIQSTKIRLNILRSRGCPTISEIGVFQSPVSRQD
jgi:alpha-L-fucosidase